MGSSRRLYRALAAHPFELVATLVAVDQASKLVAAAAGGLVWLVPGILALGARRSGAGPLGIDTPPTAALILAGLGVALAGWLAGSAGRTVTRIGGSLLLAAAIGNLIDRWFFGAPVVFLHLAAVGPLAWSGNLADLLGVAGIFLLARALLGGTGRGPASAEDSLPELASEPPD